MGENSILLFLEAKVITESNKFLFRIKKSLLTNVEYHSKITVYKNIQKGR